MKVENDHDEEGDYIGNGDDEISLTVAITDVSQGEAGKGHAEVLGFGVGAESTALVLGNEGEDHDQTHNEEGYGQSFDELEVEIDA